MSYSSPTRLSGTPSQDLAESPGGGWQTSFVPPLHSDSLLLLGDHAFLVADLVSPKAAFASVQDGAIYSFSIYRAVTLS